MDQLGKDLVGRWFRCAVFLSSALSVGILPTTGFAGPQATTTTVGQVVISTSTTRPDERPLCGDVDCSGTLVATDALKILRRTVDPFEVVICPDTCPLMATTTTLVPRTDDVDVLRCADVDCSGQLLATDALTVLRATVSSEVVLLCGADCVICGDDVAVAPFEECDGLDDAACVGFCGQDCQCMNRSPTAVAGSDHLIVLGQVVELDGSDSFDPDDDPLVYSWSFTQLPAFSETVILSPTAVRASMTPDKGGTYIIALTVSDGAQFMTDGMLVTAVDPAVGPDADGDTLSDEAEAILGTRPDLRDTDDDGFDDDAEFRLGTDPLDKQDSPTGLLARIEASSPLGGEDGVAVTRETIVVFSRPVVSTISGDSIFSEFGGEKLGARIHVSPDRSKVTLFYDDNLPASARIRVSVVGDDLLDEFGLALDGDGDGTPGGTATFDFETLTLTSVEGTRVCGRVFASELAESARGVEVNVPLEGVTITVDGMEETLKVETDEMGDFCLNAAPAGRFFVHIDGRTSPQGYVAGQPVPTSFPQGPYYPNVGKAWTSIAGSETTIGDVFLPLIPAGTLRPLNPVRDTVLSFSADFVALHPEFAGVAITIPPGSLFADNGTPGTLAGVGPVPPDRLPGPLPPEVPIQDVITLQTDNATNLDSPAPVCLPNLPDPDTGELLAPNESSALWSFNHDIGRFDVVGSMTTTSDGLLVCSDPGSGILAPGWHGEAPGSSFFGCPLCCLKSFWEIAITVVDLTETALRCAADLLRITEALKCIFDAIAAAVDIVRAAIAIGDSWSTPGLTLSEAKADLEILRALKNSLQLAFQDCSESPANLINELVGIFNCAKEVCEFGVRTCGSRDYGFPPGCGPTPVTEYMCEGLDIAAAIKAKVKPLIDLYEGYLQNSIAPAAACALLEDLIGKLEAIINQLEGQQGGRGGEDPLVAEEDVQLLLESLDDLRIAGDDLEDGLPVLDELLAAMVSANQAILDAHQRAEDAVAENGPAPGVGTHYLLDVGSRVMRGTIGPSGTISGVVPPVSPYRIAIYDAVDRTYGESFGMSAPNGARTVLVAVDPTATFGLPDSDGDGLVDVAEEVVGTRVDVADTDEDGVSDGAELDAGTDPLDGVVAATGIVASAGTPGIAVDVCATSSAVVVANQDAGVSVFNAFNGMDPRILSHVDTPGGSTGVACGENYLGVADGRDGLTVISIAEPANVRITETVSRFVLGGGVTAVASFGDSLLAGTDTGEFVVFDPKVGLVVDRLDVGERVHDIAVDGRYAYVATATALNVVGLAPLPLRHVATAPVPGTTPGSGRRRVRAGNGVAYLVSDSGYSTIDITLPEAPIVLALASTGQRGWSDIALNGAGLGVAAVGPNRDSQQSDDVGLYITADAAVNDSFVGGFPTPGETRAVAILNGLAYTADGSAGLQVVNYLPYDALGIPPLAAFSTSAVDDQAEEGSTVLIDVVVTDDVQVRNVELLIDGEVVVVDGNFPFQFAAVMPRLAEQDSVTIAIRAFDTGGNRFLTEGLEIALTQDVTPPFVVVTAPKQETAGRDVDRIAVSFSETVDPAVLDLAGFTLERTDGDGIPTGEVPLARLEVAADDRVAVVLDSILAPGTYILTIDAAVIADGAGNTIAEDFVLRFGSIDEPPDDSVVWVSFRDGAWENPANWADGTLPVDGDRVVIALPGVSPTIEFSPGDMTLDSLELTGNLTILTGILRVTGPSFVTGELTIRPGATLIADGPIARFTSSGEATINGANLRARNGGIVSILGARSYGGQAGRFTGRILEALGPASRLELPNIIQFAGSQNDDLDSTNVHIEATFGGVVDLSGVTEVSDGQIRMKAEGDGSVIDFSAAVRFMQTGARDHFVTVSAGGQVLVPNVRTYEGLMLTQDSTAVFSVAAMETCRRCTFGTTGSPLRFPLTFPALTECDSCGFHMDGAELDLSQLAFCDSCTVSVNGEGGFADLRNATRLSGSVLTLMNGATMNVDRAREIDGLTADVNDGVTLNFPAATSYQGNSPPGTPRRLEANGQDTRLEFPNVTEMAGSRQSNNSPAVNIEATRGGVVDFGAVRDVFDGITKVVADGVGSVVDFSSATRFTQTASSLDHTFEVRHGGRILAPLVTDYEGLRLDIDDPLAVETSQIESCVECFLDVDGIAIDLAAVDDCSRCTINSNGTNGFVDLGLASKLSGSVITLTNGGRLNVDSAVEIDAMSVYVRDSVTLRFPAALSYEGRSPQFTSRAFEASGVGTRLEFPSLTSLAGSQQQVSATLRIDALQGGVVDLGAVLEVFDGQTNITADGLGSLVDLSAVDSFSQARTDRDHFIVATDNGLVDISGLTDPLDPDAVSIDESDGGIVDRP